MRRGESKKNSAEIRGVPSVFARYSVLSATTGSFFAALREGMMPAMSVSVMLMMTRMTATRTFHNNLNCCF